MAKERKKKRTKKDSSDGRHLLVVGLPVGVVLVILILGAVLQSGSSTSDAELRPLDPELPLPPPPAYEQPPMGDSALDENLLEEEPVEQVRPAEPAPAPPAPRPARRPHGDAALEELARRVEDDLVRLHDTGATWTAQIGVFCDDQQVSAKLRRFANEPDFYLLPALLKDERACYRICWGDYATRDAAVQARGLPAALRGEKPLPRTVASVID